MRSGAQTMHLERTTTLIGTGLPGHGGSGYVVTDGRRPNAFCDIEVPHQLHYHCKGSPKRCSKQFVNAVAVMKTARDALIRDS
jgi:hypothetical protein